MSARSLADRARDRFGELQDRICGEVEKLDGVSRFREDRWTHAAGSGGGVSRVLEGPGVFEKGGVNLSALSGTMSERLALKMQAKERDFFATGISLVLHPRNPHVPTVHMNLRYLELRRSASGPVARSWFGGGVDLTPYYLVEADVTAFHRGLRDVCDRHDPAYYPGFKSRCDEYFHIAHRQEARGVGGIFFDYLEDDSESTFAFVGDVGDAFLEVYAPIVTRRRDEPWTAAQRAWQGIRRGRYVEFNLVYDRGTLFGLETGGRTESILMSLPPEVRWVYDHRPEPGSPEARLLEVLATPREWLEP